jgi:outer membrane receptor protein involved in Fe transport
MNITALRRIATLSAALLGCLSNGASAQLEEILVTATRRETNLQDTPLSIQAFTAEQLELIGITNGRDLGIMVPNVVLNPSVGGAQAVFRVRGLPGVGLYVDGVWQDPFGFQQTNFIEMERIEVLRGPQGTLFGRNTNGGAVNMTTRKPGDEFGARVKLDIGEFNRRDIQFAVDLPLTDTLKTKFMGATFKNDGFLEGLTTPWEFGAQHDTVVRLDALWEPTDAFSLRVTHNDEQKRGTDPRIHRMTRYDNSRVYAYNIMLGAFQAEAHAACLANVAPCQALNQTFATSSAAGAPTFTSSFGSAAGWATPPQIGIGARYTGTAPMAYNPATHTTNYPNTLPVARISNYRTALIPDRSFGPGQVSKWQTKSDSMEEGITADLQYTTLTATWRIGDRLRFEAILSDWQQNQRQVIDFDGTEFLITTQDIPQVRDNKTMEFHLLGSALDDKISWIGGYYSLEESLQERVYGWAMWEFAVPATARVVNGVAIPPAVNIAAAEYVRQTAILLGLNGVNIPGSVNPATPTGVRSGGALLTANTTIPGVGANSRYPWNLAGLSDDRLTETWDEDGAWFGEATFGVTEKLSLTVGARISDNTGRDYRYQPNEAFRTPDPSMRPQGDPFAGHLTQVVDDPATPKVNTYKFSAVFHATDDLMVYVTYAEGFTSASRPLVNIGPNSVVPSGCVPAPLAQQALCDLPPEVIDNTEIGIRSDWLDGRLRFNATYFDSHWNGMRIMVAPRNALGEQQPFPYTSGDGAGTASGWELETIWAATDRLTLSFGLGLIDTNYVQSGLFDGVTGNLSGAPFAYAADESGTIGTQYEISIANGGRFLLIGNYGYLGDYARDAAYQRTLIDQNGNPYLEPAYGILNARFVYEPAARNYSVELWGKNLTDELYINGGFDTRDLWGYDFAVVGRSREVGLGISFAF